jgi:hypothetical protein
MVLWSLRNRWLSTVLRSFPRLGDLSPYVHRTRGPDHLAASTPSKAALRSPKTLAAWATEALVDTADIDYS